LHAPIIVYSAYEQTRLKELATDFPDLSVALNALIARLADLLPIVRNAIYFPAFGFSNSIKSVAPALCPGFSTLKASPTVVRRPRRSCSRLPTLMDL
jgi:Domain of unknown function(DUF2779)